MCESSLACLPCSFSTWNVSPQCVILSERSESKDLFRGGSSLFLHMELIRGVEIDLGHGLVGIGVEGRHLRLRHAEGGEVGAGVFEAVVIRIGRPIAPREAVGFLGGFDGLRPVPCVPLNLR